MTGYEIEAGPDPLLGKVLQERYHVVRKLGAGGMGAVYEGEHLVINKRVAIKVLHPQYAAEADIVARFQQEARAATAIGHEHIVEVNDMGRTPDGAIFMVLELLAGTDFAGLLERAPRLPIGRIVHIVSQVCEAVQAAHDKGIVHRDLKPENVFLIRRGGDPDFVKVLDFGISKIQDGAEGGGGRVATKTGSVMGTAFYMSPEQAQGKKAVDHRTDVWAIGVILFKALTGSYPFDDDAFPMVIMKICADDPPPIRTLRSDIPEALADLVHRCLERDTSKRVQSCTELQTRLAPFASLTAPAPDKDSVAFASTMAAGSSVATPPITRHRTGPLPYPEEPAPDHDARPISREALAASGTAPGAPMPRWMMTASVAVVAAALAGGAVWLAGGSPEPATPIPEVAASTPEPVAPEPTPAAPTPTPEQLDLIGSPSEAAVALDPGTGVDDRRGSAPPAPAAPTGRRARGAAVPAGDSTADRPVVPGGEATSPAEVQGSERHDPEPSHETEPAPPRGDGVVTPPPQLGLKRLPGL